MTALSVRMWIRYDCECRNLRNLYFENLSIPLEERTLMADELEMEKIAWAPFFKSLALWGGYLFWPVIWPVVVCIVFPKSHEQNCSFEYPVALAIVIGFFMPVVFGLKSRWFRKWSLAIVCFWIVYIFLLLVGSAFTVCFTQTYTSSLWTKSTGSGDLSSVTRIAKCKIISLTLIRTSLRVKSMAGLVFVTTQFAHQF